MNCDVPSTDEVRSLFAYASKQELEDAESAFDTWFARVQAEAQVKALRDAADEAEAREVAIHGSAHYDSDVLFSIRDRADRIAREHGLTNDE